MAEQPSTYSGWKNYPTWCVNLWLSNDEGLYNETRERARAELDDTDEDAPQADRIEDARGAFSRNLKEWVCDELAPDLGASFAADLLGYALGEVDWYELAEAWLTDEVEG